MKKILLLISVILSIGQVNAQWQTNGPSVKINVLTTCNFGTYLCAATGHYMYFSNDAGLNWTDYCCHLNGSYAITSLASDGAALAMGDYLGFMILSTCNGGNASAIAAPGSDSYTASNAVVMVNSFIYDATDSGLYMILNDGSFNQKWDTGIASNAKIYALALSGNNLFAGTDSGVYLNNISNISLCNWVACNSGLTNIVVRSLAISGSNVFAGTDAGVFLSTNNGTSWTAAGLTTYSIASLCISGSNVLAGTGSGVFLSGNNGGTWTAANTGLPANTKVASFTVAGNNIFAGLGLSGVFRSSNNGSSWTAVNKGLSITDVYSFAASGSNIFAASDSGVFLSTGSGNWAAVNNGLPASTSIHALAISGSNIYAGASGTGGVFLSTDNANSWSAVDSGLTLIYGNVTSLAVSGSNVFAGTDDGVFLSTNNGSSWTAADSGLGGGITAMTVIGPNILAANYNGVSYSANNGTSWTRLNVFAQPGSAVRSFAVNGSNVFAGTISTGVYVSTDSGINWAPVNNGLPAYAFVPSLAASGGNIYAGTDSVIFESLDNGQSWMQVYANLTYTANALIAGNANLYAGTGFGVWQLPLADIKTCDAQYRLYPDQLTPHHWFVLSKVGGVPPFTYSWDWGDGSNPSIGDTASHIYNAAGHYNICLTITDSTGCSSSYCDSSTFIREDEGTMISINAVTKLPTTTGISQMENESSSVYIYPNPAYSQVFIKAMNYIPQSICIYDVNGRRLAEEKFALQLDISTFDAGIYFIEIRGAGVLVRKKLVKL